MLRPARDLKGCELQARDGAIGQVDDLFFDDRHWTIRYFVVATGSWLSLNGRDRGDVLVSPHAIAAPRWADRALTVDLTREQVRNSPPVDTRQPVSREHEAALIQYYNWPAYWGAAGFPDAGLGLPLLPMSVAVSTSAPRMETARSPAVVQEDPHLRSTEAVRGHLIEATDGTLGHVEDFLVDDTNWEIRALIVDTRNWWPGKKVLVPPQSIEAVGWSEARVRVQLTREAIKVSPTYEAGRPLPADFVDQLAVHRRPRG